ncbi:MAG: M24 family metallopeptidase [Gemmatimonadota bacterium]
MSKMNRRGFLKAGGAGLAGSVVIGPRCAWPDEGAMLRASEDTESFRMLRAEQAVRKPELFEPADYNRLPMEWYKSKARELKEKARERGVDGGIFLQNRWNVIYATGLFHSTTERLFTCFLPMDDDEGLIWFYPYLDEELVKTWWHSDAYSYFDWHHAEGGNPYMGQTTQGRTIDIPTWWGETLARLGYAGKTIGVDSGSQVEIGILPGQEGADRLNMSGGYRTPGSSRPTGGNVGRMLAAMPGSQAVDVSDIFIQSRMVKDEMENRLAQRAEDTWSEVHAFARNYIQERGLGTLDLEVTNAAQLWGMDRIMQGIQQQGELHNAVGINFGISCRSGPVTGFPHPNQQTFSPIEEGHALQVSTWGGIGGYGGEQYRSYLIHPWTEWQERVWEVHTETYHIQARESYEGNTCSNVAKAVHDHQIANEMERLVYHRPGHGSGSEGHQPPYQALGDYTVMRKGMHFSNEPGLYDPENSFGFNHSNNIVVAEEKGLQLGTAPVDKEWCFLRL